MHLKILACDLDGTLTEAHHLSSEVWASLRKAKAAGFAILFVTGRILERFINDGPFDEIGEAVVAEDGAVVYFPRDKSISLPFGKLTPALIRRLEGLDVPLERGRAILATHVPHDGPILNLLREVGGGATVEYNRGAVMILPPGATKGTGLQYALRELGYSARNLVGFGDAENDISLFETAELAVAVANSSTNVQRAADLVTTERNGKGFRAVIDSLLEGQIPKRHLRPERRLELGEKLAGPPFMLDPFLLLDRNLGVLGSSSSGKSWLAGLLAEKLLQLGYQICIIDPEGDYRNLRAVGHTLILGGTESRLPPVIDVVTLAEYSDVSLILDLSAYSREEGKRYVTQLLHGLISLRSQRGRPHWFLFDEIQNFCSRSEEDELSALLCSAMQDGGVGIVSYRPGDVQGKLLDSIETWLLTQMGDPEDLQSLKPFVGKEEFRQVLDQLPQLPAGQAYFMTRHEVGGWETPGPEIVQFRASPRRVPHVRHVHKYLRVPLADEKRFYFRNREGQPIGQASSLWHFQRKIGGQALESVELHLRNGDFERWIREVLRDPTLADRIVRLRKRGLDAATARRALSKVVRKRIEELESLT